ncbi:hypothetical protein, partial [Pectobacterium versatile]|uniref:hypothetical protein n=1 Tax=Pectobacterium versatile TaxID=2488639 RepID=UPI000AB980ED
MVVMLCLLFVCLPFADVVASLPYSLPVHLPCLSKVIFCVAPQIAVLFFAYVSHLNAMARLSSIWHNLTGNV